MSVVIKKNYKSFCCSQQHKYKNDLWQKKMCIKKINIENKSVKILKKIKSRKMFVVKINFEKEGLIVLYRKPRRS